MEITIACNRVFRQLSVLADMPDLLTFLIDAKCLVSAKCLTSTKNLAFAKF